LSAALEGDIARIAVEDTGPGFDDETAARLFHRFQQGDGSLARRYGGGGLGLAICRGLADLMEAELTARSAPGEGACFELVVNLPPSGAPAVEPALAPEPLEGPAPRFLIVDDNEANRRLLHTLVAHLGAEASEAENGADAVEAWRAGAFDAILMDMQMPVLDGLGATRRIREAETVERRTRTPIVMISANAMPEHIAAAGVAGADAYLPKPLSAADLFRTLASLDGVDAEAA
jgi:CheY-like chemotaxis protein